MTIEEKVGRALIAALADAVGNLAWYALMAGTGWFGSYVILRSRARRRKIIQQGREVAPSLRSLASFGIVAGLVAFASMSGFHTRLYGRVDKYGWP